MSLWQNAVKIGPLREILVFFRDLYIDSFHFLYQFVIRVLFGGLLETESQARERLGWYTLVYEKIYYTK